MNDRDELIDETVLRRSLRFEADERVPRFDANAIAAQAAAERPWGRTVGIVLAATVVTSAVAGTVWSAIASNAPAIVNTLANALIDLVVALATVLVPVAEIASQPVVPLSLLAALGVAIAYELRERREHVHAHAS